MSMHKSGLKYAKLYTNDTSQPCEWRKMGVDELITLQSTFISLPSLVALAVEVSINTIWY